MALEESEVMSLSLLDLNRMKTEFSDIYQSMFTDSYNRLRRSLTLKLKAMKICAENEAARNPNLRSQMTLAFSKSP